MRIGVCGGLDRANRKIDGLSYIEPTVSGLLCPAEREDQFEQRLATLREGVLPAEAVNCFFPGGLKTTGPEVDIAGVDAWVHAACKRSAQAGVKYIVYGSGGSRRVPEGFAHADATEQIVAHLKRWGPIAGAHGVVIVVEPLNKGECNIINSVDEGADAVRAADHPNIRLLADTFHMVLDGESPEAIVRAGELIRHAHCAEGEGRVPVGLGSEDHRPFFKALKQIRYAGGMSIEAKWEDFDAQLPKAVATLRRQIDEA